ncbi:MAG: hypothetical protein KY443_05980, partial [Actinobacteria bacterium]|nr:hypothetical protein [Actinomycetota bacterium]
MTLFSARSRLQTYSLIIGTVMGIFAAGVAVPLIFAEPAQTVSAGPSLIGDGDGSMGIDGVPGSESIETTTEGAASVDAGGTAGTAGTAGATGGGGTGASGLTGSTSGGGGTGGG